MGEKGMTFGQSASNRSSAMLTCGRHDAACVSEHRSTVHTCVSYTRTQRRGSGTVQRSLVGCGAESQKRALKWEMRWEKGKCQARHLVVISHRLV